MTIKTNRLVWRDHESREALLTTPSSIGEAYGEYSHGDNDGDDDDDDRICDGVAVVTFTGPIEHHRGWWWASFEGVECDVKKLLERQDVRAVVLKIDSPGGVASGMSETSRAIRRAADKAGKPLYAFANEQVCSAAYGLACAADEIWSPPTGEIGSIGVILPVLDVTESNRKFGVKTDLIVTGKRKGDGHPWKPLDKSVRAALQARVDAIGNDFFALVAERRGMTPDDVRALEAGVFQGRAAVKAGLSDGVASWEEFLETVKASVSDEMKNSAESSPKRGAALTNSGSTRRTESTALARIKGLTMKNSKLALIKAKKECDAATKKAAAIKDPKKRAKALQAALDTYAKIVASSTYKKTVKVEKTDDDGDDDEDKKKDDEETDEDAEDEESDDEESEDEETDEDAEDEPEEDAEDEESDDEEPEPKKKGIESHRAFAGTSSKAERLGRLDALVANNAAYQKLSSQVGMLTKKDRSSSVEKQINAAIREHKISSSDTKQIKHLRAIGMESPKRLAADLDARPRLNLRSVEEGVIEGADDADLPGSLSSTQLSAFDEKIIEQIAARTGKTIEVTRADYLATKRSSVRALPSISRASGR